MFWLLIYVCLFCLKPAKNTIAVPNFAKYLKPTYHYGLAITIDPIANGSTIIYFLSIPDKKIPAATCSRDFVR